MSRTVFDRARLDHTFENRAEVGAKASGIGTKGQEQLDRILLRIENDPPFAINDEKDRFSSRSRPADLLV
jgi:hypothetical protein